MNSSTTDETLTAQYQQKTDREHILDNPDTYIGSVETSVQPMYLLDCGDTTAATATMTACATTAATSTTGSTDDNVATATTATTDSTDMKRIIQRDVSFNPGLYKLFDEGIVNCRDHVVRMNEQIKVAGSGAATTTLKPVTYINITIDPTGLISMENDGNGIDVAKHPEYETWIPELIFGHMRTSTNYNKKEDKIVGGKNGFGFKLVLIWSTEGRVETIDHTRGLKYVQSFGPNLSSIGTPKITKCAKSKPMTKVSFRPDYQRLGIKMSPTGGIPADMLGVLVRRIYDIAAVTDRSIKVRYNGTVVPVKGFGDYIDRMIGTKTETRRAYETPHPRWEYSVSISPNEEFTHVSFVNGIYTSKGGKHVEYLTSQITRKLIAYIASKKKMDVKATTIKEQLMIVCRCDITNPSFDSQTKDYMSTPSAKFGSSFVVSDPFIEKLAKMGIMDAACALTQVKETAVAAKKTDGSKKRHISGIPKLIDANMAGTARSHECTIILCEGDSAKAGIVSGLSKSDRDLIGIYPMKGKLFNVRGEMAKRIAENKEITDIKKIVGLENGKKYSSADVATTLRYGRILFMTDQDLDGSHIKGLGLNLFEAEWNSLSKIPDFIGYMNTPILKARKGKEVRVFYSDAEFALWKGGGAPLTPHTGEGGGESGGESGVLEGVDNSTSDSAASPTSPTSQIPAVGGTGGLPPGWTVKYYKGLGTSTAAEFKEYFKDKKIVMFNHTGDISNNAIDMVFNKKRADDRKTWLSGYDRNLSMDCGKSSVTFEEFIDREMIHFSKYDCDRSIPNVMDGLKISLRKILFAAFKKRLHTEIKVAQFTGYVSEHSGYHHGEASLNGAIVGMAQNFVGSNNINLFQGNGQFGTRLQGGGDSASERYIFTLLHTLTRLVYPEPDDHVLTYLADDGLPVEPVFYAPIIPMLLVNGSKGIGTGFSTDIMCHDPKQIIARIRWKLQSCGGGAATDTTQPYDSIDPYYEGFTGTIERIDDQTSEHGKKYLFRGTYRTVDADTIHVTELPVGFWTEDFKLYLETLLDPNSKKNIGGKPVVREYTDMSTDTLVDFTVKFQKGQLAILAKESHDHSVDGIEKLLKLTNTRQTTNMHAFDHHEHLHRYDTVDDIVNVYFDERLAVYARRRDHILATLLRELTVLRNKVRYVEETLNDTIDLRRRTRADISAMLRAGGYETIDMDGDFKYLVKMSMDSVSDESIARLTAEMNKKSAEYTEILETTERMMWLKELDVLESAYLALIRNTAAAVTTTVIRKKKPKKITIKKPKLAVLTTTEVSSSAV